MRKIRQGGSRHFLRGIAGIFRPERIEDLPAPPKLPGPSFLGWLFGREALPVDEVREVRGGRSFLREILAGEALPLDPQPGASGRPSFLKTILAREQLPEDPAPPGPRAHARRR